MKKRLMRAVPLWLVIILLIATTGTVVTGLTLHTLTVEKISIWGGLIQDTQFTVTGLETKIKGKNKIEITLSVKNTDSASHNADVTVQLLDANEDVILEETKSTGSVGGEATWSSAYSFNQSGLVDEYASSFVTIKQTS